MIQSYVFPITNAIMTSHLSDAYRGQEAISRREQGYSSVGFLQHLQMSRMMDVVSSALQACGRAAPSFSIDMACLLTPIVIGVAAGQRFANRHVRVAIDFVQDHLGHAIQLVTIVALAVLLVNGHALYASISLGYMAFKALPCSPLSSQQIPYVVQAAKIVSICGGLILGYWPERIALGLYAIQLIANRFLVMPVRAPIAEVDEKELKAEHEAKEVFENLDSVNVACFNPDSYSIKPEIFKVEVLPPRSMDIDLYQLGAWFDEMDRKEFESGISQYLNEAREASHDEDPSSVTQTMKEAQKFLDELVKDFDKSKAICLKDLKALIDDVAKPKPEQPIVEGNRKRMHYYLRYICSRLPHVDQETRNACLVALALSNGDKALSTQFAGIAKVFYGLLERDKSLTLKEQILVHLQKGRQELLEVMFVEKMQEVSGMSSPQSMMLQSAFCETFGLQRNVLYYPCQSGMDKMIVSFLTRKVKPLIMDFDSDDFNAAFYDKEGACVLDKTQVIAWWHQWINRQDAVKSRTKPELLRESLDKGVLVCRPVFLASDPNRLDPNLMIAMLFQMGLMQEKPRTSQ